MNLGSDPLSGSNLGSHAERMVEHIQARGMRVLGVARPVASVKHMECGVLLDALEPAAVEWQLSQDLF